MITNALRDELDVWRQYLEGDVYGYMIEDASGEHIDSCWGFYGREYAIQEMSIALEFCVARVAERKIEVAQGWAMAHGLLTEPESVVRIIARGHGGR